MSKFIKHFAIALIVQLLIGGIILYLNIIPDNSILSEIAVSILAALAFAAYACFKKTQTPEITN